MSTIIEVTVDDAEKAWLDEQVKAGRFANSTDFVRTMIAKERSQHAPDWLNVFLEEEGIGTKELTAFLDEGVASGFAPYTQQDLQDAREELDRRRKLRGAS